MLKPVTRKLLTLVAKLTGKHVKSEGEFSKRIKKRHKTFWKDSNAEIVRNTIMSDGDPIKKWKNVKNWQRKLSNKYNSREFAKMHNCKVPDLYWKGRDYNQLDFEKLPQHYVIRPTTGHSSYLVFLMNNSVNLMNKQTYSGEDIRSIMAKAINENPNVEFLVEEFVRTEKGEYKIPDDYKVFTFNGEIACIRVYNRLSPSEGFTTCYDENWKLIDDVMVDYDRGTYQQPPKCLAEIIAYAKALSKSYEIFIRIDFYATDKGAVFGEFTPTPGLGQHFSIDGDELLADYWDRFCKGKV